MTARGRAFSGRAGVSAASPTSTGPAMNPAFAIGGMALPPLATTYAKILSEADNPTRPRPSRPNSGRSRAGTGFVTSNSTTITTRIRSVTG